MGDAAFPTDRDAARQKVLDDLEEVRAAAMENGKFSEALKAVELAGKHLGLFTGKPEPEGKLVIQWADEKESGS